MNNKFAPTLLCCIVLLNFIFSSVVVYSIEKGVKDLSKYELAEIFSIENISERLSALEKIYSHSDNHGKFLILPNMCKAAIQAKQYDSANKYAKEALSLADEYIGNWNYGNVIHDANIALGMVALHEKDINEAKKYLIKAGNTTATPQLTNFGPNLMLAKALLNINETAVVKEYFILLKRIWTYNEGQLDSWISTIDKGSIPYLDKHLDK